MLISDYREIGAKLLAIRKRSGLTQGEAAERAGLSDRTYADIERGSVNMRVETLLKICRLFRITPNELLTKEEEASADMDALLDQLRERSQREQNAAAELLSVYLKSTR